MKNSGQDLSFEWSNIFVGSLKVGFWAIWKKKSDFAWSCDPIILSKMGEFAIWQKMTMFRELKNQLLVFLQKCLTTQMKDLDLNFSKTWLNFWIFTAKEVIWGFLFCPTTVDSSYHYWLPQCPDWRCPWLHIYSTSWFETKIFNSKQ